MSGKDTNRMQVQSQGGNDMGGSAKEVKREMWDSRDRKCIQRKGKEHMT